MAWFEGFEAAHHEVSGMRLFVRTGGPKKGPAVLLLHGFPQTHAMWHRVAQQLADRFFLVLPDLRGCGDSAMPPDAPDHISYSKRTMAVDMAELMHALGRKRYAVVGHNRGARVAHRLALDHPRAVRKLALIDVCPGLDMYAATDMRLASLCHHWFHLIQPAPLPERMVAGDPRLYLHHMLSGWGGAGLEHIEPQALAEYERCFCREEAIHAMCEDHRAGGGIDLQHELASREAEEKIRCETLVLWGEDSVVGRLFEPPALWDAQCEQPPQCVALPGGHALPEELPEATAQLLRDFL